MLKGKDQRKCWREMKLKKKDNVNQKRFNKKVRYLDTQNTNSIESLFIKNDKEI